MKGYIYEFCIADQSYYTSTDRRHRGRGVAPMNQQHENFVINYLTSFPFFFVLFLFLSYLSSH
ncbi:hypothetical protein Pint_17740 [Pistacia integerrima]|uniref:Uncharacterized protein n=1 Tax=Pistacia integerrima TaxID=434235 RepID=A0ACC0YYB1_9ROSI|nr:hypothetical protein Pint_17740 [Pistacia integerrima]